jgi:hypothetical protein
MVESVCGLMPIHREFLTADARHIGTRAFLLQRWSKVMAWFGERILTPNDPAGPKSL